MVLAGCGPRDPVDRLMHRVSNETVWSYPFKAIDLPATATPEELVAALSKRRVLELGHFEFRGYKISQIRSVQTEPPESDKYTAVVLETSLGQKIVLLQPIQRGTNWGGWYYETYDAE